MNQRINVINTKTKSKTSDSKYTLVPEVHLTRDTREPNFHGEFPRLKRQKLGLEYPDLDPDRIHPYRRVTHDRTGLKKKEETLGKRTGSGLWRQTSEVPQRRDHGHCGYETPRPRTLCQS